jgi:hypothetical protein
MDLTEYDAVEMHPVARETRNGMELFEQCDRDSPDLHCWSVYLHMKEGGISCIADCPNEEIALFVAGAVEARIKPQSRFEVQTRFSWGWENVWAEDDRPLLFDNLPEARDYLADFLKDRQTNGLTVSDQDYRIVSLNQ